MISFYWRLARKNPIDITMNDLKIIIYFLHSSVGSQGNTNIIDLMISEIILCE